MELALAEYTHLAAHQFPSEVKSVSINPFENVATLAPTVLSNTLTEALKDKFSSETNLIPLNSDSDLIFSGLITNYSINPIAIQADETASKKPTKHNC